jgi:hypothetical protein
MGDRLNAWRDIPPTVMDLLGWTASGGEPQSFFGLARIVEGEGQAAALAALGATNRFLGNG